MQHDVKSGIPQGSILRPIVFLLLVGDLAVAGRSSKSFSSGDVKVAGNMGDMGLSFIGMTNGTCPEIGEETNCLPQAPRASRYHMARARIL